MLLSRLIKVGNKFVNKLSLQWICPNRHFFNYIFIIRHNLKPMLHRHGNVEMDTARGHMANSWKYIQHVCPTRVSNTFRTRHGSMIRVYVYSRVGHVSDTTRLHDKSVCVQGTIYLLKGSTRRKRPNPKITKVIFIFQKVGPCYRLITSKRKVTN